MDKTRAELDRIKMILKSHQKGLTIAEIAKILDLNRISTSKYLNMLVASGQAEMRVHGPSKVYYPCQRVPISTILNFSTSLLLVMDRNLMIIDVNNAVLDFFLLERRDCIGHRIDYSPLAGYIDRTVIIRIQNALESIGSTLETKWEKDGEERYVQLKFIPTVFETGDPGVTLIAEDITELSRYRLHLEQLVQERSEELILVNDQLRKEIENHKKARNALKTREMQYRELVENANSIILKTDKSGNIIFFNEFAQRFFGYSEQEIIGQNIIDTIIPLRDSTGNDTRQMMVGLIQNPEMQPVHVYENIKKNGDRAWIAWTNRVILDEKGRKNGMLSIGNDITERKWAEEQLAFQNILLSTQLETTLDGVLVVDENGLVISYNRRCAELWGIPSDAMQKRDDTLFLDYIKEKMPDPDSFVGTIEHFHHDRKKTIHDEVVLKDGRFFDRYSAPMVGHDEKYYGRVWYFRDITEERAAKEKLRQSEEKMSRIIDFLPDATFVIDTAGTVIAWNHAMEDLTGVQSRDILGMGNYEYAVTIYGTKEPILIDFAMRHETEVPKRYVSYAREGDTYIAETYAPFLGEGGTYLWGMAAPLYDSSGILVGAIESIRNVTKIKRTEQELKASEERYRAIIEDQIEMICRCLPDGSCTFVNEAYTAFFKKPKGLILGTRFWPQVFEADRAHFQNYIDCISVTNPVVTVEIRISPREGEIRLTRWNIRATYSMEGKVLEYLLVGRDITDYVSAKETNEYQALLLRQIPDAIVTTDHRNRITFWNHAAEALFGWTPDSVQEKDVTSILGPDLPGEKREEIRAALLGGGAWKGSIPVVNIAGRRMNVDWSISRIFDPTGKPAGVLGVGREIQERK